MLLKQVTSTGFMIYNWTDRWGEAFKEMRVWIDEVIIIGFIPVCLVVLLGLFVHRVN